MVPAIPFSALVFGHSTGAFDFLERLFDKKTQTLHAGQFVQIDARAGITQAVFDFRAIQFAPNQQMPTPRTGFLSVPNVDPGAKEFGHQVPLRPKAQQDAPPGRQALSG